MHTLLVVTAIYICLVDMRSHRIPNWSLLPLALPLTTNLAISSARMLTISLLLLWLMGALSGLGMGDIKLLSLLLVTQGSMMLNERYIIGFSLIALIFVIYAKIKFRSFRGEIPLAPAILIPFIAIYLGF